MVDVVLPNSTYLDLTSYGTTTATTVANAYGLTGQATPFTGNINVALILPRANDPTALLQSDWATRQSTLAQLETSGTLWSTYGATTEDWTAAYNTLNGSQFSGIQFLGDAAGSDGYITSQDSRTIWVQLTPANFEALFGTTLYVATTDESPLFYWDGCLSLPDTMTVAGLWFDTAPLYGTPPAVSDMSGGAQVEPPQGPQSIGNQLSNIGEQGVVDPNVIANAYYNFPLAHLDVPTMTVGLIEPSIGDALPSGSGTFQEGLDNYRQSVGVSGPADYYLVANNGEAYDTVHGFERSADAGIVSVTNPNSAIGLYVGSGTANDAHSNAFTAFQAAFWDEVNNPSVTSSSYSIFQQTNPDSPFAVAVRELFTDAALLNVTHIQANNDYGSSWSFGNGLANQATNSSSPYIVVVGGTSLTTLEKAPLDPSIAETPTPATSLYGLAMADDPATLWRLIAGGLTVLPSAPPVSEVPPVFLESVWNSFQLVESVYGPSLGAGDGGVDTTQPTPWYQTAFGLTPTTVNPSGETGRGAPDVSANAGGNMFYLTPNDAMTENVDFEGTSAAAPLWASLMAQIDAVFVNQGLPVLGFMNDLLYIAAAVAPASFHDTTSGNNVTSFIDGGSITNSNGQEVTFTGYGYEAGTGYDLATGLGSPNGLLLARALTAIGHAQTSFSASPAVLDFYSQEKPTSGANQTLMFQVTSDTYADVFLALGAHIVDFSSAASAAYAWTGQLAQQSLQPDFAPALVQLFDRQSQGATVEELVPAGVSVILAIGASVGQPAQGTLTSDFGFVDFMSGNGTVRAARPVALAETAGGQDDQTAIVRLRQNGTDDLSLTVYRVDDLMGAIDSLLPGDAGYAAAAQARAYQLGTGGTSVAGPGYGAFGQTTLRDVDGGDLIALTVTNATTGNVYWAFAQANEMVAGHRVGHLWSYGLNTWGFEDTYGGGDRDFNDLIVGLDFTSTSGDGWLA